MEVAFTLTPSHLNSTLQIYRLARAKRGEMHLISHAIRRHRQRRVYEILYAGCESLAIQAILDGETHSHSKVNSHRIGSGPSTLTEANNSVLLERLSNAHSLKDLPEAARTACDSDAFSRLQA